MIRQVLFFICLVIGISSAVIPELSPGKDSHPPEFEEDQKAREEIKSLLVKDLKEHLDYLLTVVPKEENRTVKDFLLSEVKISGDFTRSWYARKKAIVDFLEKERNVQKWLNTWRNGKLDESADYFINAAENYKTWSTQLGISGPVLLENSYRLLFDDKFKNSGQVEKKKLLEGVVNKLDHFFNSCDDQ